MIGMSRDFPRPANEFRSLQPVNARHEYVEQDDGHVRVEQIKINAPDVQLPNLRVNLAIEDADRNQDTGIVPAHLANREVVKILIQADRFLDRRLCRSAV